MCWRGRLWAVERRLTPTYDDHHHPRKPPPALAEPWFPEVIPRPRHFLRNKKSEWEEYRSEVTAFELRKNLPVL